LSKNTLYELAKKSKNEDVIYTGKIIELFDPKIKSLLSLTSYQKREDLYQELRLKLLDIILTYDVDASPGFWDLQRDSQKSG
jgi:flagellar biosynthesis chaperone FliJ